MDDICLIRGTMHLVCSFFDLWNSSYRERHDKNKQVHRILAGTHASLQLCHFQ